MSSEPAVKVQILGQVKLANANLSTHSKTEHGSLFINLD